MSDESYKFSDTRNPMPDQRRHPRHTVFKSALLYPVLNEASLSVVNISHTGLSGQCALTLAPGQPVHVSFEDEIFRTAEVRWTKGAQCGLLMEEPLLWIGGKEPSSSHPEEQQARDRRLDVDINATLISSGPVMAGTIRNMSLEGMMIEAGAHLSEGAQLLVKTRGSDVRMGRVQWSSGGMSGLFFETRMISPGPYQAEIK